MTIVCMSASNIKHTGQDSTFLKTCNLIKNMLKVKLIVKNKEKIKDYEVQNMQII
ncbi:hypothetical protein [Clostridium hydrogenum]|uniref:hypothetical protein n=1 Tax=Clostridium hydrogenum TaxID=2855764 RepID=UPI001F2DDD89|nr:hypothetical protein [Clostridium hydrogenum]